MSQFEEDNIVEEEAPIIHLELDDGTVKDCAVITLFEVEGQDYIALVSVEDLEAAEEDEDAESALLLYRYNEVEDEPEAFRLDNIEDDEEYEMVTSVLDAIFGEEDDEE